MAPERERRFEPWPLALACALAAMITVSVTFFAIAQRHPDPVLVEDAYQAGLDYNAALRERARAEERAREAAAPPEGEASDGR